MNLHRFASVVWFLLCLKGRSQRSLAGLERCSTLLLKGGHACGGQSSVFLCSGLRIARTGSPEKAFVTFFYLHSVVAAPSLAGFKARLDGALSKLRWWKMSLLMAGGWNWGICKVPSNPYHAVILISTVIFLTADLYFCCVNS